MANAFRSGATAAAITLAAGALGGPALDAQELPFLSDPPRSGSQLCQEVPTVHASSPEGRAQAAELTSNGDQAVIVGDLPRALALFDRAVELDPGSADLAYRRARVLESLAESGAAIEEYCRAMALSSDGEFQDARSRADALVAAGREGLPEEAILAFETGLLAGERGATSEALASFERATAWAPRWASAEYNRGVALARLGRRREAATALLRYLELRPDAPNALAVSKRIGELGSLASREAPSPGVTAALGVLVPGMGHFYSGRPLGGLAVLALAGGAIAAGLLVEEVDVRCLTPVQGGEPCPDDQVVSRTSSRPYVTLGVGAAAAVGLVGAIEAFLRARGARAGGANPEGDASGPPSLVGPSVTSRPDGVDLRLLGLRFR